MTVLAVAPTLRPDVATLPVQVITGTACFYCRCRFTVGEQILPVPHAESGLRAARRHTACGNVTPGGTS